MSSGSDALPLSTNGSGERPFRVMVADDGKNAADIMGMFLKMEGYEVMVVYSGEEAVEAAGDFDPQVILMDISMPGMDGLEATRQIRQARAGSNGVPVIIALSGYDEAETRRRCEEAGMQRLVSKPVSPADLRSLLGEITAGLKRH
ncbi:response regulator [Luteolibacter luteus]|uniref:Response regulator n=1 Tax=Luteolibacter luteus TaxID=2728835 RepID=A0A858RNT6_9BACT|nr:response regulator [Luteolibacter luteus]QJE98164.1 response regulator [Luteolibacter luteus]